MKSFARLSPESSAITVNPYAKSSGYQTPASTMKTLIITCLSFTCVCTHFARAISATGTSSACSTYESGCAGAGKSGRGTQAPATNVPPGQAAARTRPGQPAAQQPAAPGQPGAVGQPAAPGQPGAVGQPAAPGEPVTAKLAPLRQAGATVRSECRTTSCFAGCSWIS